MDPWPGLATWRQSASRAQTPSQDLVLPGGLPVSPQRLRSGHVGAGRKEGCRERWAGWMTTPRGGLWSCAGPD